MTEPTEIPKGEIHCNLTRIMVAVIAENKRSNDIHGNWDDITHREQAGALMNEYSEWLNAYYGIDVYGEHGEVNELIQLMNVCAKRILYLSRQERGEV